MTTELVNVKRVQLTASAASDRFATPPASSHTASNTSDAARPRKTFLVKAQ